MNFLLVLLFWSMALFNIPQFPITQKLPAEIVGEWDLWIPGAITSEKKNTDIFQKYEQGSMMSRLRINNNGEFKWGNHSGVLKEEKPWYAQETIRYFRIQDMRGNIYDLWHKKERDELVVLFGEVGGHAATGTRIQSDIKKKSTTESLPNKKPETKPGKKPPTFKVKDQVNVYWSGLWYKGIILDFRNGNYLIHYEGWNAIYDEWVSPERIKK